MPRLLCRSARPWSSVLASLLLLGLAGASPVRAFTVSGATDTVVVAPGGQCAVDVVVRNPDQAFNAFDLSIHFDPAFLTNVPLSPVSLQRGELMLGACALNQPFHIFTPAPDSLVCTLVILCNGVTVTGPGTIYHLRFQAAVTNAWTSLTFGPGTGFFNGGPHVDGVTTRPIVVKIGSPVLDAGGRPRLPSSPVLDPVSPNPARTGSPLAVSFSLPRAESCEVLVLDPQGRRVAGSARTRLDAGPHRLQLPTPALAPGRYTVALRTESGITRTRPWVVLR